MNHHLGVCPDVPGADSFVGFYFNARSVAEAFPWFPDDQENAARAQIVHFFHCCWSIQIVGWLIQTCNENEEFQWLLDLFRGIFKTKLIVTSSDIFALREMRAFLEQERDRAKVGTRYIPDGWELSEIGFLDTLSIRLVEARQLRAKPLYFFLDDYSTPLVTAATQRILNCVIFRRSATAIFKIATESTESLEYVGMNAKILQLDDDFVLIDSGFECLQRGRSKLNRDLLEEILRRRILRDRTLSQFAATLLDVVGDTEFPYTELARRLRARSGEKKPVLYHGRKMFCDIWCSNTREIIRLFSEMLRVGFARNRISPPTDVALPLIKKEDQDNTLRAAGAKYRDVLLAASSPSKRLWEIGKDGQAFGERLVAIADAFAEVADLELRTKTSKNQAQSPPKQARRIEITDASKAELAPDLWPIYQGLIRYGVFLSDARGKSASGKAVDRLVLRGILIPHYTLSLSKRDSIFMSLAEFSSLLRDPEPFPTWWRKNKTRNEDSDAQCELGLP